MDYNPTLKKAMEEIKAILDKYDCAGLVVLHKPGNSEYLMKLNPSYSCAFVDDASGGIRVRAKKADYVGKEKERDQKLADTSNMFRLLTDTMINLTYPLHELADKLDEAVQADHSEGGHSSHNTQNN